MSTLEEIYNKNKAIVAQHVEELKAQVGWYTKGFADRQDDRRVAEKLIEAIDANLDLFPDMKQVRVLGLACGVPYLWEYLREHYGIRNFVGVDLMEKNIFDCFLEGLDIDYSYHKQDIFIMTDAMMGWAKEYRSFDIVLSGNIIPRAGKKGIQLSELEKLANDKNIIIHRYNDVRINK